MAEGRTAIVTGGGQGIGKAIAKRLLTQGLRVIIAVFDHAQHPAGRVGVPEDIAALAAFLLPEEAGFITGQNLVADGGMTRKMIYEE